MKKIKKPISVLLAVMMVVGLFSIVPFTANAYVTQIRLIDLLDENPDAQTLPVTGEVYVDRNITIDKTLRMTGDTELIVEAGCTLTLSESIMFVYGGYHDLTISGAGTITGTMSTGIQNIKELVVNVGRLDLSHCNAAGMRADSITINGGNITVRGMNPVKAKTDINLNGGVIDCLNYQAGGHIYVNGFEVQASDIGGQVLNIDTSNADYTIRWKNADGSTLKTDYLKYGQTPSYSGATPTKTGDAQYRYNFSGWSPKILIVTENMTYTAQFSRTVNSYTVTWEDDDGTTLATDIVEYGKTPSYSGTTPTKASEGEYIYTFRDWTPSVSTVSGNVTYTAEYTRSRIDDHFSQNGDTCTIHDALGWDIFCDLLAENNKGYFDGKTVMLDDDISVTRMAGGSYHDFTGTFDGQGHTLTISYGTFDEPVSNDDKTAPFRNAESGCVIKNLRTAGTIYTSKKYAGGFIGTQYGTVRLENCRSSVTINSLTAGDGTHGGFVGNNGNGSDLTIDGCVFDGKILSAGETATTSCSGFVGYKHNSGTITLTNCVYDPAALEDGETEVSANSATFVRNGSAGTNCYYTRTLGTAQGKQPYTISAGENVTLALSGTAKTYTVSGITAYENNNGLLYGDTFYAGNGDSVSLTLGNTTPTGYAFAGYTVTAGALQETENPYTLTMPDSDVTVNAVFEAPHWTSGDCTVTYDPETHTMTVTGSGAMANYSESNPAPWASYNDSVTSVVISDGVTGIGEYAFEGFSALTNLSIANTVTSISEAAFLGCGSLKDITIPASVTSIGRIAFNSFSQDVTVTFVRPASQSTLTIGNWTFNDDAALYYSGDSKYALFDESEEIELTGVPNPDYDCILNDKTLTWELPVYAVKVASANGTVTASVNGEEITEAYRKETVLLTVTPDEGYRFKSITATVQKERAEDLSDLVAMMGDAVFEQQYDYDGRTCKVEGGNFVVFVGETVFAELSESNIENYHIDSGNFSNYYVNAETDDERWSFEIRHGKIVDVEVYSTSNEIIFDSKDGSQSTGTLPQTEFALTTVEEGAQYSFTMPDKEVTVTAEFTYADGVGASVIGHSISLDGDIAVNFYMELAPEIAASQTAYMQFTIPNGDKTETQTMLVSEAEEKNGYYVFKCNVAAKDMASQIKAQIIDGDTVGDEYTYSVKEYADYLLAHTGDNTEYAKAAPLVRAMLRYGAYAKEYFDKTNTLDPLDDVNINIDDPDIGEFPEGTTFDGATLSLKSKTTLSLYLTSDVEGLTFTCVENSADGQPVREMTVENVKTETGYIARIRDIAASELKNNFTLTVKNGETVLGTITYSPMNYCYKALHGGTTDERLINAVKALVAYADAAKVYFG